ncbi:MAG TPA: hypothetical protein VN520_38175 [Streptomyces sp.]|uniref:hypothetical protein n=1 Tax=Streptomyces sp. TaxID=1931 RepID=UPI002C2BCC16|nr:hypothetical protein [Streptomyces sp.]HWU12109.1 hypothetical protein [Streptomyces sp.]
MTHSVRVTCGTIGGLLMAAALVLPFLPGLNIWPWVLMFGAVGIGLAAGAYVSVEDAQAERARAADRTA